ncbi:MBNL2.2 family protein [Megaselia abdita]
MAMVNMTNLLNGKDSRWLQLEVCREFQRNKCTRQDTECKFAHPPANVEVQNGKVTACYDSIKGRCNRDKPPCKYFHPPQHLKDQLLINGRNHLALKNAIMQQMGIPGQQVLQGQIPAVGGNPYLTSIPTTYNPYFATGHLVPTLLGPDPSQLGQVVPSAVPVAQQKIPRSDRLEAFSGMVPFKRPATDKSGIPVYPPGAATATTYQQLMQLQHPFVPVSCEYQNATSISTTQASQPQYLPSTTTNNAVVNPIIANNNNLNINNNIMSIKNHNIMNSNPSETFTTITTTCNSSAVAGIISSTTPTTSLTTSPSSMTSSNINSVENNIINNVVNVNVPVTVASNISCSSNSNDNINVNGGVTNTETTNDNTTTTINTNGTANANEVNNNNSNPTTNTNTETASSTSSTTSVTVDPSSITANTFESQNHIEMAVAASASATTSSYENGSTQLTHTTPSYSISHYQGAPAAFSYALPSSQTTYTNSLPQQQSFNATYSYPQSALAAAYANYYQDPAAIAKEVAQKNYAFKLAASSNAFAGKSLTAYAGMAALNKPLMSQPLTATPTGLRVAPQVATATGAPPTAQNPFAQRPIAANYYQQLQAAQAQYLRPQMNPFAAAVAQQQFLIPQQQMQQQFFQYPGMIPGVAANSYSYGIPMSAAGAVQTSSTPIAQVSSVQQQPAATTNSAVVLNPYKKMKTS